jgi:MFS family permease
VTFRDVFAVREYRAVYASLLVNWLGDYLTKAAVTVLVYEQSQSVLMSAAAFALSFLPWIIGGTLLSALAERYPYRRVLIFSDLSRMIPIALLLVPGLPIAFMLVLVFLASLGTPPTQAARSALLPLVVGRDKLPTAVVINQTTSQTAQVVGYLAGAAIATAVSPRLALSIDLITFALSAAFVVTGVRPRPPAQARTARTHLLAESAEGFRMVFGRPTLRAIAIMIFMMTAFAIVPEGLAAAWAAEGNPDPATRGLSQGLIMAAAPIGYVIGGLVIGRLIPADRRDRQIPLLALLTVAPLIPALLAPPPAAVAFLVMLAGIAQGGLAPTLNAKFVLILPHGFRARAFGVMQTGMQLSQFSGVIITGLLAERFFLPLVVGLWSIGGTLAMAWLGANWPSRRTFRIAMEQGAIVPAPDGPASAPAPAGPASTSSPAPTSPAPAGPRAAHTEPAPAPRAVPVATSGATPERRWTSITPERR